ncbi:MAG: hypothetical protein AEth_01582 [Candidatus Argoarchaeum ethanivorans]|uniref:Uncharacterized protein n=1 Tax=Candidatus Argoarchaeum ethanivorans TaxID=2608793 RepID=A0A8B3S0Y8_9EURY|nr:MAG: hypothetical protein AEth_01582 [Candidatus Argoarchaeum ethanivorans]
MVGIESGNIEIIVFIFGGFLLLIGILGGGFEVKELKIPKVGPGARIVSIIAGLIFILLAFGLTETSPLPQSDGSNNGPVDFTIYNSLGEGQISEQVTVVIDGKDVGTLTINEHYPNSRLKVTVPKPGQISYSLVSAAVFDINGELFEYNGVGQGIITVEQGKDFSLYGSVSGNTWLITIIEGTTPTVSTI